VFLDLVKPLSRVPNPRCMINTRKVETIIQMLLAVNNASLMIEII
jgi:hypothetical protein